MDYVVLAFYLLRPLSDPGETVAVFKRFFADYDVMGRVYVSEEGINAQLSVRERDAEALIARYSGDARFAGTDIKRSRHHEHAFPGKTVKYRAQLVAFDKKVDLSKRGTFLSPERWCAVLDEKREGDLLLDVRNDYEWEIGRFKGAEKPPCRMFREFPAYATRLKKRYDPEKTCVLMYCTGGIRCEYFSSLLRAEGYVSLHQLRGGVLGYGREVGTDHWEGNLFVFDDRLVIPLSDDEGEPIAHCRHCKTKSDACYNCANMECNALFPCCVTCCGTFAGCCSPECMRASRVRPCKPARRPKPFRKLGSRNGG